MTKDQRIKMRRRFETTLRKLWMESPYRSTALARAKVSVKIGKYKNGKDKYKVKYRCGNCGHLFEDGSVEVDHKTELTRAKWDIPLDEDMGNLVPWMESLFCDTDALQILCKVCHAKKTARYMRFLRSGASDL
ncbi:MAG: HNH endonuclease [Bacteriovoracaceae bacterium]|nr:HNH endonuclease [Bacteriovoracaceae bacterium]